MQSKHKPLSQQFYYAMQTACSYGSSKRSERGQRGRGKSSHIYSYSSYETVLTESKSFVKFLKEYDPSVHWVRDITQEHVLAYLNKKAETCNDTTLTKVRQNLISLSLYCNDAYHLDTDWRCTPVHSRKVSQQTKFKAMMSQEQFQTLATFATGQRDLKAQEDLKCLYLARYLGMRVDEIAHQKTSDFCFTGGLYGYGYVQVTSAKHGRIRQIPILSVRMQQLFREIVATSGETVTKSTTKTLNNRMTHLKQQAGIDLPLVGWHGIRKLYAQTYYDFVRLNHSRREAVCLTNEALGHGSTRGVDGLKTYVQSIH